ncbi:sulfotransferase 1C3-like isoform X2 [Ptychodera flava]|uniref:sulfotransferase 1C3-like isoform X2 n=1 Tax=Ptychodera flava TaxID=63121 RepID=UPI00396A6165
MSRFTCSSNIAVLPVHDLIAIRKPSSQSSSDFGWAVTEWHFIEDPEIQVLFIRGPAVQLHSKFESKISHDKNMANLVGGSYRYKGIPFLDKVFPKYCLEAMETFEVREDDVFVVTYPRSGTVMMQQIISLIVDHEDATAPTEVQLRDRIPFLERHHPGKEKPEFEILQTLPSPRFIKTHLARQLAPPQMFEKKAKVLHLVRNPKDTFVSNYHFQQAFNPNTSFNDYLDNFLDGEVTFGSWFEHTKHWLSLKDTENVMVLHYEDVVRDMSHNILKIADFLIAKKISEEKLEEIVKKCSFDNMRMNKSVNHRGIDFGSKEKNIVVRKGVIGDWKNYFTVAQNERFDAEYRKKMAGVDVTFKDAELF